MTLRILIAHAYYRQRGGEDVVAEQEAALLERHGHTVERLTTHNADIDASRPIAAAMQTLWSRRTTVELQRVLREFKPDVVHVHNTFPSLSPSLYWAVAKRGTPVVQTLHNFRLVCPQAMLLRDGGVCEDCLGHAPWRAVMRSCYHDSAAQSAVVAGMLSLHRALGTYDRMVTRYIALNEFCRKKFAAGGLPQEKIVVKPNFADVPPPVDFALRSGALFAGRVAEEKGIRLLMEALASLPSLRMEMVGNGPDSDAARSLSNVRMHGWLEPADLFAVMRRSAYLVMPSIWYENSPRVLIEAFGCGLPVIASRLGALAELVEHGVTGLLFDPASATSLADAMRWAEEHPVEMRAMGRLARRVYENRYSPTGNYSRLLSIYREAIEAQRAEEVA